MKRLYRTLLPLLLLIPVVACNNQEAESATSSLSIVPEVTNLKATSKGHFSEPQLNYLTNNDYSDTSPYNGNLSVSKPEPIVITWESNISGPFKIVFSSKNDNVTYISDDCSFDFYNPLFNEEYTVSVYKDDQELNKTTFTETPSAKGPRSLYVDGVENFRDIGGWGYIKQGMIYRSGRFNEDKADPLNVTVSEDGIKEINEHLKIKTEIDLRRTSNNEVGSLTDKSVLGDKVSYIQIPMAYGGNNILTFNGKLSGDSYEYDNPAAIKSFFELLANKDNYPINFHCSIGKDRTGCLAYLIEGLLGFDQETMYRDYMFTNFANAGMCKMTDVTSRYGDTLDKYDAGDSTNKIYSYLNEVIGVSKENLDNIINILKA